MYTHFTDDARAVVRVANQQAIRFKQDFIGPEHILLALFNEESEETSKLLTAIGIDLQQSRAAVEELARIRSAKAAVEALTSTPTPKGLKDIIGCAMDETHSLGQDKTGVGHILLGLLRSNDKGLQQILTCQGVTLETARAAIQKLLSPE